MPLVTLTMEVTYALGIPQYGSDMPLVTLSMEVIYALGDPQYGSDLCP